MSEKELIRRCKKGDRRAQRKLYDLYSGMVMFISKRYTSSTQNAEDIFQEAFIRVFEGITKVDTIGSLKNWVYTIAVRASVDALRKRRVMYIEEYDNSENLNPLTNEHLDVLDKLEYEQITELVRDMPDGYRLVFNLYLVEGYSHKEIGELLDISESTSRSQLTRCKQLLKKSLEQLGIVGYEKAI